MNERCRLCSNSRHWISSKVGRTLVCATCDIPAAARTNGPYLLELPPSLHTIAVAEMTKS